MVSHFFGFWMVLYHFFVILMFAIGCVMQEVVRFIIVILSWRISNHSVISTILKPYGKSLTMTRMVNKICQTNHFQIVNLGSSKCFFIIVCFRYHHNMWSCKSKKPSSERYTQYIHTALTINIKNHTQQKFNNYVFIALLISILCFENFVRWYVWYSSWK